MAIQENKLRVILAYDKKYTEYGTGRFYSPLDASKQSYVFYYADAFKSEMRVDVVDLCDVTSHDKFIAIIKLEMVYFEWLIKKHCSNNNNDMEELVRVISKLSTPINRGQCMLIFDTCTWPMIPTLHKTGINRIFTILKAVNIKCTDNIVFVTSAHKNNENVYAGPFRTVFFEFFENALRIRKKNSVNYDKKLQNLSLNTGTFRFLYLNHKEKAHRLYLFIKIFSMVEDFYKMFAASMCPGRVMFSRKDDGVGFIYFQKDIVDFIDDNVPKWLYNTPQEKFIHHFSRMVNRKNGSISTSLAPWSQGDSWKSPNIQWTLDTTLWEKIGIYIGVETNYVYSKRHAKEGNDYLSLTEKTFKPIMMKTPFILFGQPFILKKLKEYGYMTFNSCWDESYDEEISHVKRANKIANVVARLAKLSDKEFADLLQRAKDIVEHNYRVFHERRPEKEICDTIVKFYEEKSN